MKHFIFDIETVIDENLVRQVHYPNSKFEKKFGATHQYQDEILESTQGKSNFIPHTYHLPISLAFVAVNEDFSIAKLGSLDRPKFRPHEITRQFWGLWHKYNQPQFVTFNGRGFDLPVMELCAFRYNIPVPQWFQLNGPSYAQARNRYNTNSHFDLMDFLTNFGASRFTGGMNLAATLIGKPGKMDTKGSMVQELYEEGSTLAIDDYCLCDALDTYFIFLRTQVLMGSFNEETEHKLVLKAVDYLKSIQETYLIVKQYLKHFQLWKKPDPTGSGFYHSESFQKLD